MKRMLTALLLSASSLAIAPPAAAQFGFGGIVFDPTNYAQNLLTAARSLTEIENQIHQLAHEAAMLENMGRNLSNLPTSVADELSAKLSAIDTLIKTAEGLSYKVSEIESQYEALYPESYGASPPPGPTIVAEAEAAWKQSRQGYKHALEVQAQVVANVRDENGALDGLVGASQGAEGNLQALQAGNQIAALSAEQMMQIQTLLAAQYRAEALDASRALAERERGRARLARFLGHGSAYTPGGS